MSKETIIFIKGDGNNTISLPEDVEGIYYPIKFDSEKYLKWKNELDPDIRVELLKKEYTENFSLYLDLFNKLESNFISAADREYMTYLRFLLDPRNPDGVIVAGPDAKESRVYRQITDSECRFSGKYKDLYSDFITVIRHCAGKKPVLAPKYVIEALQIEKILSENQGGEFSITCDVLPRDSWKSIFRWTVLKNFIENKRKEFPELSHLLEMYGEPTCSSISANLVSFNEWYADIVDSEDAPGIIGSLKIKLGEDNVKNYELLS